MAIKGVCGGENLKFTLREHKCAGAYRITQFCKHPFTLHCHRPFTKIKTAAKRLMTTYLTTYTKYPLKW